MAYAAAMKNPSIELVKPNLLDKQSFLKGLHEFVEASDKYAWINMGEAVPLDLPERDFAAFVSELLKRETQAPEGLVAATVYWAKSENEVVGRISIRHELNDFLRREGGHIGYIVHPAWRKKGIATEMLRQILYTETALSIGKLLLTCDEENIASEKTILKNGGSFESTIEVDQGKPKKKRFWISIPE